jgi:uncharacterized membrane protein
MKKETLYKILGILIIAFAILLTVKFVKMLPAVLKVAALGANVAIIYQAYNSLIKNKKEKEDGESN